MLRIRHISDFLGSLTYKCLTKHSWEQRMQAKCVVAIPTSSSRLYHKHGAVLLQMNKDHYPNKAILALKHSNKVQLRKTG